MILGHGARMRRPRYIIFLAVLNHTLTILQFFFHTELFFHFVKVGSRLIELLMETAYVQPPVDQAADGPPDIRPAFRHSLRTVTKEQR